MHYMYAHTVRPWGNYNRHRQWREQRAVDNEWVKDVATSHARSNLVKRWKSWSKALQVLRLTGGSRNPPVAHAAQCDSNQRTTGATTER